MTVTEKRIEDYYNKFWDIDKELGGRDKVRLYQWKFEALLHSNYNNEEEFLKTIKEVEVMNGNSILYEIFNGKAIKTLSDKMGNWTTKQLEYSKIIDYEVYYFVVYVYQQNSN